MIYIESLEDLVTNLELLLKDRMVTRRRIFKFLRTKMDFLKETNPWTYGKMMRGYSSEISDSQLVAACKGFMQRNSRNIKRG